MTDEEIGRNFYQYNNRGWPNKTWTWENLTPQEKEGYIKRAKRALERDKPRQSSPST